MLVFFCISVELFFYGCVKYFSSFTSRDNKRIKPSPLINRFIDADKYNKISEKFGKKTFYITQQRNATSKYFGGKKIK